MCVTINTGVGSLVGSEAIMPLDDLVDQYGADIKEACGEGLYCGNYNGSLYAVPIANIDGEAYGFTVMTKLLDKYNISVDESKIYTLDEVEEILDTIQEGEGDGFHALTVGDILTSTQQIMGGAAVPVDELGQSCASGVLMLDDYFGTGNTDYKVVNMFATEEYQAAAERIYRWANKGYFADDCLETANESTTLYTEMKSGEALGSFGMATDAYGTEMQLEDEDCTLIRTVDFYTDSAGTGVMWSVPITSAHPEAAIKFLNLLYGEDRTILHLIKSGIEGEDYEIVEDNGTDQVITYIDGAPYRQMLGVYGNVLNYFIESPIPITKNEEYREINANISDDRRTPVSGYIFSVDNVSTEYAAVNTVVSEYHSIITTGRKDPAEVLPEFLAKLEAAGIDTIIEENQRQLDEFLSNSGE